MASDLGLHCLQMSLYGTLGFNGLNWKLTYPMGETDEKMKTQIILCTRIFFGVRMR